MYMYNWFMLLCNVNVMLAETNIVNQLYSNKILFILKDKNAN